MFRYPINYFKYNNDNMLLLLNKYAMAFFISLKAYYTGKTCYLMYYLLRFERIGRVVPMLDVSGKYQRILTKYHEEIEKVTKMYNKMCENPPPLRGLPPVAG